MPHPLDLPAHTPCEVSHTPTFDAKQAVGLSFEEVATRWPRHEPGSHCRVCGAVLYVYQSVDHMLAGGWV